MKEHVDTLPLDFAAANALSSLFRAANAVRAELTNRVLRNHDLTWTGFVVLWVVWIWDGMETRHVAESADISKATLTGVVKTLESRGLILREGDENDRRLVRLRLTPEGMALMEQIYPRVQRRRVGDHRATCRTTRSAPSPATLRDVVKSVETNHNGRTRPDPPARRDPPGRPPQPIATLLSGGDQRREQGSLVRVRCDSVLRVPLHAEVPATEPAPAPPPRSPRPGPSPRPAGRRRADRCPGGGSTRSSAEVPTMPARRESGSTSMGCTT